MIITPYIISLVNEMISTVFYSIRLIHDDYGGIRATTSQLTMKIGDPIRVKMDNPNITMEEYIRLEKEKARRRVSMPSFPSPEPEIGYFNDLDFFKDVENEFPAIVYNDALTSKSDLLTEPTISPRHIDEFNLNDETSLSECDEEEQNVLYFNDLFPFNVIYPDDLKLDTDNDNDKIDIEQPSGDMSVISSPNEPSEEVDNVGGVFINLEISEC
ncbi:hypothetical protein Tco_0749240 [Tanacetum coccineum]|uniref:Uncharacterized protein n=1 Tax=Tanacetum coccineum TaxID=301880 RepID=A0ABQ4YXU6_9ASTR